MNCSKNYTFGQLYIGLSNIIIPRELGLKFDHSTFGYGLLSHSNHKIKYVLF
jgi:hypothetical protein